MITIRNADCEKAEAVFYNGLEANRVQAASEFVEEASADVRHRRIRGVEAVNGFVHRASPVGGGKGALYNDACSDSGAIATRGHDFAMELSKLG